MPSPGAQQHDRQEANPEGRDSVWRFSVRIVTTEKGAQPAPLPLRNVITFLAVPSRRPLATHHLPWLRALATPRRTLGHIPIAAQDRRFHPE